MTDKNRYTFIIWYAFLLAPLLIPVFVNGSVIQNTPFIKQNPTVIAPQQTVGTTDSLQKAQLLFQRNNHKEALKLSLDLLNLAINSNDSLLVEKTSYLIATIFRNTNNYEKALEYFKKSKNYVTDTANLTKRLSLELYMGDMFYKTNKIDSADFYLKKIIAVEADPIEIKLLQAKAYANLSAILINKGDLVNAEINVLEALYLYKKFENSSASAQALNNLASIYLQQNRYRDSKRVLFEALSLVENDNTRKGLDFKETIYDNLSWTLYKLKDYHTYIYQEKSFSIRDSLRNSEISGFLAEIEGKFNEETIKKREQLKTANAIAKKEHAQGINNILIIVSLGLMLGTWLIYRYLKLRQENLQLEYTQNELIQKNKLEQLQNEAREKILNATLDGKESERKMIAETLHHSVSSLLSSASLHLQASKKLLKETPPVEIEKAQNIVNEAADKIRNLSHFLVSSVLLKFGLSYAVQDLCDKYSNAELNFHSKSDNIVRYDSDFELKINSIIDELLNNIIKHSKATNAEISLQQKKKKLKITILDDGKGFDPTQETNKDGLGLRQIEARVRKMKGVFKIASSENEGTSIYISVPIVKIKENETVT